MEGHVGQTPHAGCVQRSLLQHAVRWARAFMIINGKRGVKRPLSLCLSLSLTRCTPFGKDGVLQATCVARVHARAGREVRAFICSWNPDATACTMQEC